MSKITPLPELPPDAPADYDKMLGMDSLYKKSYEEMGNEVNVLTEIKENGNFSKIEKTIHCRDCKLAINQFRFVYQLKGKGSRKKYLCRNCAISVCDNFKDEEKKEKKEGEKEGDTEDIILDKTAKEEKVPEIGPKKLYCFKDERKTFIIPLFPSEGFKKNTNAKGKCLSSVMRGLGNSIPGIPDDWLLCESEECEHIVKPEEKRLGYVCEQTALYFCPECVIKWA